MDTRANPLTARVLILFKPELEAGILLAELAFAVQAPKDKAHRGRPDGRKPANDTPDKAGARDQPRAKEKSTAQRAPLYVPWHGRHLDEALAFFDSSPELGLSTEEASRRLQQGHNTIPTPPPVSSLEILVNQFKSLPIILLGVSAGVSVLTGGLAEGPKAHAADRAGQRSVH